MKLLFLLQEFPFPPSTGISRKTYALLAYLSARGWKCDILCFGSPEEAGRSSALEVALPGVKVLSVIPPATGIYGKIKRLISLLRGLPPSFGVFSSGAFREALLLAGSKTKYDAVHYDVINMAQYLPWGPKAPSLLSANDAISLFYARMAAGSGGGLRRAYLSFSAGLIARFERQIYPQFDAVHVVSKADAEHLKKASPDLTVEVIPLSADVPVSAPLPSPGESLDANIRVAFTGNLDIPGIASGLSEFLNEAFEDVSSCGVPFDFYVLGPRASSALAGRLSAIPGVKYFRWVEDYMAFLSRADILLVLDKSGTGIKTRVLDAMALAKPVVGGDVAFSGLEVEDGRDCFVCGTPSETGAVVKRLLADAALRKKVGDSGRALMLSKYSMSVIGPRWEALYAGLKGID